jgi:hypothetical protein
MMVPSFAGDVRMTKAASGRPSAWTGYVGLLGAAGLLLPVFGCGSSTASNGKTSDKDAGQMQSADAGAQQQGGDASTCGCKTSWQVDNLDPCWDLPRDATGTPAPYSSHFDADAGMAACEAWQGFPHAVPNTPWSAQRLQGSCGGTATLCLVVKQGDVKNPKADDCQLAKLCNDVDYKDVGQLMELPPLPGWAGTDAKCAKDFYDNGGYFEMVAKDYSLGDCFKGTEDVIGRVPFCPVKCSDMSNAGLPECETCGTTGDITLHF